MNAVRVDVGWEIEGVHLTTLERVKYDNPLSPPVWATLIKVRDTVICNLVPVTLLVGITLLAVNKPFRDAHSKLRSPPSARGQMNRCSANLAHRPNMRERAPTGRRSRTPPLAAP